MPEVYPLLFAVAGALIAVRLPRHPVGWLMLFVGPVLCGQRGGLPSALGRQTQAAENWVGERERAAPSCVPATLLLVL